MKIIHKNKRMINKLVIFAIAILYSFTIALANTTVTSPTGSTYVQITEDTVFTVPKGITSIKAVIIGGGTGGQAGSPGANGDTGYSAIITSNAMNSLPQRAGGTIRYGGAGGAGGSAGSGGKVKIVTINTSDITELTIKIGQGGAGGVATTTVGTGAYGTEGTASTIQAGSTTYSSADGNILSTGYLDEQTSTIYATKGNNGYDGASGGNSGWANSSSSAGYGKNGGAVSTYTGGAYSEHNVTGNGSTSSYKYLIVKPLSSGGGGAAYGNNGSNATKGTTGGGKGGDAIAFEAPTTYGSGGHGGNGGGGGGGGGSAFAEYTGKKGPSSGCWHDRVGAGGAGGAGSNGTDGAQGVVLLMYDAPSLKVSQNPEDTSTTENGTASFYAEDSFGGVGISYQWYKANDATSTGQAISGATSKTYTISNAGTSLNNTYYYCSMTDGTKTVKSSSARLLVYGAPTSAPIITVMYNSNVIANGQYTRTPFVFNISTPPVSGAGTTAIQYSFDNGVTWSNYTSGNISYTDVSKPQVTITARAYNSSASALATSSSINILIDNIGPTITEISGNPTTWVKDAVLQVTATDISGLATNAYSWNNGEWTSSSTYKVTENKKVNVRVMDYLGNITSTDVDVTYIDSSSPVISSITGQGNSSSYAKSRTITVNAYDSGIGLDETGAYCFDGKNWTTESSYTYYGTTSSAVVKVRDSFGLVTEKTVAIYTDNTEPVLLGITGNPPSYQKESCTVTVSADDVHSGLNDSAYSFNGGEWQSGNTFVVDNNMNLVIKIRDKAGNELETSYQITNIDKTPPKIVSVAGNPTTWATNATLVINASDNPGIGLAENPYSWDGGKTWTDELSKEYTENKTVEIQVKDALDNISKKTVEIKYIDRTSPAILSVSGEGTSSSWAQSRTVTVQAEDAQAGLNEFGAYCFDGINWQKENTFEYAGTTKEAVVRVKDNLGHIASKTINIYVDNTPPNISKIEGNPEVWQNTPCTITVTASDAASGLAPVAYNFNDEGWQASNSYEVANNMTVQVSVIDMAGNIAEKSYKVTKVDTSGPTLSVSYPSVTDDKQFVVTALYGVDNVSKKILYCFDYKEDGSSEPYWTESNQQAIKSGTELVVACKDELGNITKQTICPTAKSVHSGGGGTKVPIFTKNVISCGSYILGGAASGKYMDKAGTVRNYQAYSVNGAEVSGIAITVSAAPSNGGILSGYAKIMGQEFPIYWDSAFTTTTTSNEGQGTIIIDAGKLSQSTRNDTLTIVINEFEDASMENILNSDSLKTNISIDTTPPVTNIFYNKATQNVEVTTKDTISGLATVKYRITTAEGTGEWQDYTTPFSLTARSQIEIEAVDKLGNTTNQSSVWLEPQNPAVNRGDGEGLPDYRSYYFDYYIEGV